MSCSSLCVPSCAVASPAPLADTRNEPCVRQFPSSNTLIQPLSTVVTFPSAIFSSSIEPTTITVATTNVGAGYKGGPGGFGSNGGHRGYGGYGVYRGNGSYRGYGGCGNCGLYRGYGGYVGYGCYGSCGHGGSHRGHRYLSGNCGLC